MRLVTSLVLVVGACGSKASQQASPPPADHQLHRSESATGLTIKGKGVPLATLPTVDWFFLPAVGEIDVDIDIKTPHGLPSATGSIAIACPKGCQIGDDKTRLKPPAPNDRAAAFAGDGFAFGHVDIGTSNVVIGVGDGKATIKTWDMKSKDLEVKVTGFLELGNTMADSRVDGCIRFKLEPALLERDAKTAVVFQTMGAVQGGDGFFHIRVEGPVSGLRFLARDCDAPNAPSVATPAATSAPKLVPVAPVAPDAGADLAAAFTRMSETTFEVDLAQIQGVLADPTSLASSARVVPAMKDGRPVGWKFFSIVPGSLYHHAGFKNGDLVKTVAGHSVSDAGNALEAYTAISRAKPGERISIEIERSGKPMTLDYTVR
jgi:type II secretory pathway component PulC